MRFKKNKNKNYQLNLAGRCYWFGAITLVFMNLFKKRGQRVVVVFLRVHLLVECAVVLRCTRPERTHGQHEDRPSPEQAEAAPSRGRFSRRGGGGGEKRGSHSGGRTAVSRSLSGPFVVYLKAGEPFVKVVIVLS